MARLAYTGLDGRPRVVPIWFMQDAGDILMVTGPKAEKVRALQANGAVALTIDTSQPPPKALLIDGDAALEHVDGIAPEYEPIVRRYLGAATEAYLSQLRIKRQVRIRVTVRSSARLRLRPPLPEKPQLAYIPPQPQWTLILCPLALASLCQTNRRASTTPAANREESRRSAAGTAPVSSSSARGPAANSQDPHSLYHRKIIFATAFFQMAVVGNPSSKSTAHACSGSSSAISSGGTASTSDAPNGGIIAACVML